MSTDLVNALLRELLADPEAMATLRRSVMPEQPPLDGPGYTIKKLAVTIGLSEKAIRNAIGQGELQARKRRGRWITTAAEVRAWLGEPETELQPRRSRRARPLGSAFDGLEGWR